MKRIGDRTTPIGSIKPQGAKGSGVGEYKSIQLQMSGRGCKPSKSSTHRQAMVTGPYGGKKPQS